MSGQAWLDRGRYDALNRRPPLFKRAGNVTVPHGEWFRRGQLHGDLLPGAEIAYNQESYCIGFGSVRPSAPQLRKNENVRQDPDSGAWYAEVENYPDCQPHWVKVGGAHETERAAIVTLVAARFGDGDV